MSTYVPTDRHSLRFDVHGCGTEQEFQDIHNRAVVLRGGSNYSPYRGQECRWIEANDGTPRDGPQNASNGNGIPACWNRSVAGYEHRRAVDDNVLGSYDPATGKNLSHPM
eukprot:SAG11_NODE_168_length_13643_cov_5.436651_7_plen_110_part_00